MADDLQFLRAESAKQQRMLLQQSEMLKRQQREIDKTRKAVAAAAPAEGKRKRPKKEEANKELMKELKKLKAGESMLSIEDEPVDRVCANIFQVNQVQVYSAIHRQTLTASLVSLSVRATRLPS